MTTEAARHPACEIRSSLHAAARRSGRMMNRGSAAAAMNITSDHGSGDRKHHTMTGAGDEECIVLLRGIGTSDVFRTAPKSP
jgi:hypothetical protein